MQIADIVEGYLKRGDYYQPEATPEIPYPVRHQVTSPFFDPRNHGNPQYFGGSTSSPTPDQKVQGRQSRVPDLSTSTPAAASPGSTAGGNSLPSLNDKSEMMELFI